MGFFYAAAALSPDTVREAFRDPNIAWLAILAGILGIYCEFIRPGMVAPGVAGGMLTLLGIASLSSLPLNPAGLALLTLSASLFLWTVMRTNLSWLGTITAGVALIAGTGLLIDQENKINWLTAVASGLPFTALTGMLSAIAIRARGNKKPIRAAQPAPE